MNEIVKGIGNIRLTSFICASSSFLGPFLAFAAAVAAAFFVFRPLNCRPINSFSINQFHRLWPHWTSHNNASQRNLTGLNGQCSLQGRFGIIEQLQLCLGRRQTQVALDELGILRYTHDGIFICLLPLLQCSIARTGGMQIARQCQ